MTVTGLVAEIRAFRPFLPARNSRRVCASTRRLVAIIRNGDSQANCDGPLPSSPSGGFQVHPLALS
jgi:hypothetical protein